MEPNDPKLQEQAVTLARAPRSIRDLIQSKDFENAVRMGLPKHITAERFMRVALNATMRTPALAQCSKESFFLAMLELSALGIEPDGRRAHLIPFRSKFCTCNHEKEIHRGVGGPCTIAGCGCKHFTQRTDVQLIIDYKGLAELVRRSGDVSYMHADAVYKKDTFDFKYGSGAHLEHRPNLEAEDRGPIIAFYSYVKLRDGNEDFVVMPKSKVDDIRKRSKAAAAGPWVTDYEEMGKKSVFRNHSKWLPLSPEVKSAIDTGADAIETTFDADGAITLAEDTVSMGAGEDHLDRKMREQAESVDHEQQQENRDRQEKAESDARKADQRQEQEHGDTDGKKVDDFNPPWPNRLVMITAFQMLNAQLGDKRFYSILGNNGIETIDDKIALNATHAQAAFKDLIAAQNADDGQQSQQHPEFEFGSGKKGRGKSRE